MHKTMSLTNDEIFQRCRIFQFNEQKPFHFHQVEFIRESQFQTLLSNLHSNFGNFIACLLQQNYFLNLAIWSQYFIFSGPLILNVMVSTMYFWINFTTILIKMLLWNVGIGAIQNKAQYLIMKIQHESNLFN